VSRSPRNRNRFADDRLWDDAGRVWSRSTSKLSRSEVETAITDPRIRLGVHEDFGQPIRWVDDGQKRSVWTEQVQPDFADGGLTTQHARPRGRLPYTASIWESNGEHLLIFEAD
jgi:hypothetical protein